MSDRADGASVPPQGTQAAPIEKQVRVKGSFPGPPSPGLGPVMYPPASGDGADRRQDLQPEVFILQLVASSAWDAAGEGVGRDEAGHRRPGPGPRGRGTPVGRAGQARALLRLSAQDPAFDAFQDQ